MIESRVAQFHTELHTTRNSQKTSCRERGKVFYLPCKSIQPTLIPLIHFGKWERVFCTQYLEICIMCNLGVHSQLYETILAAKWYLTWTIFFFKYPKIDVWNLRSCVSGSFFSLVLLLVFLVIVIFIVYYKTINVMAIPFTCKTQNPPSIISSVGLAFSEDTYPIHKFYCS